MTEPMEPPDEQPVLDTFDLIDPAADDPDEFEVTDPADPSYVEPWDGGQGSLDPGTENTP